MSTDPRKGGVEMSIMDLQGLEVPGERDAQALGSTISGGC
ncbi:class III lanthipeptide [Streptomyces angustmyceticus]|nr:class III lanthipeptide [Streptomyces angustmyceticus]